MLPKLYQEAIEFILVYGMCLIPILIIGSFCLFGAAQQSDKQKNWLLRGRVWQGHEVIAACLIYLLATMVVQSILTEGLKGTSLQGFEFVLTTIVLALGAGLWWFYNAFERMDITAVLKAIAIACFSWALVVPALFGIYLLCNVILYWVNSQPASHPLANLDLNDSSIKEILFICSPSIASPLLEEIVFRGIIMRWAIRRSYRSWIVTGMSGLIALILFYKSQGDYRPLLLWSVVLASVVIVEIIDRPRWWPRRMGLGIVSSALLFSVAHGTVWPTPIPLFIFGIVLGYLTARTGTILASFILHGLFNLVSCLILLRQVG